MAKGKPIMSFLNKIKQGLGIGTLEAKLNIPGQIAGSSGQIEGDLVLTAKSDQHVLKAIVRLEMVRTWDETKQRRDDKGQEESYTSQESDTIEIGQYENDTPFDIKAGEVKTIHFTLLFQLMNTQSAADAAIEQGGVPAMLGTLAKLTSNMRNERIEYHVKGKVDLKDAMFDRGDSKKIIIR
jgi:hypothetical protein